ncbi:MAG: ligand-binding protein SH3 [Desulfuromonas sp.]|nr:MAG: ligand-binding protein SH3 [Desulfuromonas sp.]
MTMNRLRTTVLLFALLALLGNSRPVIAVADDGLDVLEGFESTPVVAPLTDLPDESDSPFRLSGWFKLGTTWNFAHQAPETDQTDWRGLSRLRPELLLEGDLRLSNDWRLFASVKGFYDFAYGLNDRDNYSSEVLDEYEKELELREAYITGALSSAVDLKVGRQIVVWGRSDNLRVTDILNPLDQREPGLTDIEDLRLPVTMVRLDAHTGPWTLTGLVIPEIRFDKQPVYGHDIYPYTQPLPPEHIPADGLHNAEYAAALNGIFSGWDISFYFAYGYADESHVEPDRSGSPLLKHSRLTMLGLAGERAWGNVLFYAEAAWLDGLEFFNSDKNYSRTDLLGGIEYSGFRNTTLSFEMVRRHLNGYHDQLALSPDQIRKNSDQSVLRLSRTFLHERLILTALASYFGSHGQNGALQRLEGEYELAAAIHTTVGVVLFQSGNLPAFQDIGDSDRFFAEVKWEF